MEEASTSKSAICKIKQDEMNAKRLKKSPADRNKKKNDKAPALKQNQEKNNVSSELGKDYQVQWLMKVVFWAIVKQEHKQEHEHKEYTYVRLGTKAIAAGAFDSLIFECTEVKNGAKQGLMLHCKHTTKKGSQIKFEHLLVGNRGDFSLVKYFLSYIELLESELYKNGYHKDLFIVTNYEFDTRELEYKKIVIVLSPNAIWDSLMGDKKGNCYKFSSEKGDLIQLLEKTKDLKDLKDKLVRKLIREVIDSYLKNKLMSHEKGIFKIYHVFLATEVFDIRTKKFRESLLKAARNEDELGQRILTGIERETNFLINRENVNVNNKFNESDTGLEFSVGFGEGNDTSENFINNVLREFLDRLTFAVVQPDVEELSKMMQDDIKPYFDRGLERNEAMYLRLKSEITGFYEDKKEAFLSFDEAKGIIGSIKPARIVFDMSPVQNSFTGRIHELGEIHEALQKAKTSTISGMGGVGKTELARKFAHEYEKEYDLVVWFDAEEVSKIEETFCRLAEKELKISLTNSVGKKKKISSILEEVYEFLEKRNCLFIFDNVLNLNADNQELNRFLPKTSMSVHILITSQNCKWRDFYFQEIKLHELKEAEAIEFVKKALEIEDDPHITELIQKLQCFPLALKQATAYIRSAQEQAKNVESQFTIKAYLELHEESQYSEKLLDYKLSDDSSNAYAKTTLTTWGLAVGKIEADKDYGSLAIKILNISAYLDPDKIPTKIFTHLDNDTSRVGRAIDLLKKYSLVTFGNFIFFRRKNTATISVHRLVQFYVRSHPAWKIQEHRTIVETTSILAKLVYSREDFPYLTYLRKFIIFLEQFLENNPSVLQKLKENDSFLSIALDIIKTRDDVLTAFALTWLNRIYNDIRVATVMLEAGKITIFKSDRYEYLKESINLFKKYNSPKDVAVGLMALSSFVDEYSESRLRYLEKSLKLKTQAFIILKNCEPYHQELLTEIEERITKAYKELRRWLRDKPFEDNAKRLDYFIESQVYFKLIRPSKYENLLRRFLPRFQEQYGRKDDRTADLLFDIGTTESVKNVEFLERALKIYSHRYGGEYFKVIRAYEAVSLKYVLLGKYKKAHEFQVKACEGSNQNQAECYEIFRELKEVFVGLKLKVFLIEPLSTSGEDIDLDDIVDQFELNVELVKFLTGPQELKELKGRAFNVFNSTNNSKLRELLKESAEVRIKECGYRHKIVFAALYALCSVCENATGSGMFKKCMRLLERALNVFKRRYGLEWASPVKVEENDGDLFQELNKRFCDLARWHSACIYTWKLIRCIFMTERDEIESFSLEEEIDEIDSLTQFAKLVSCAKLKIVFQCSDFFRRGFPQLFDSKLLHALETMQRSMFKKIKKISLADERQLKRDVDNFQRLYDHNEINLNIYTVGTQFPFSLSVIGRSIRVTENFFKLLAWLHYQKMNDEFLHIDSELNMFLKKQDLPRASYFNELCCVEGRIKNIYACEYLNSKFFHYYVNKKSLFFNRKYKPIEYVTMLFNRIFKIDPPTFSWEHNLRLKAMNIVFFVFEALEECRQHLEREKEGDSLQKCQEIKKEFENVKGLLRRALLQSETLQAGNCPCYFHKHSSSDSVSLLFSLESE